MKTRDVVILITIVLLLSAACPALAQIGTVELCEEAHGATLNDPYFEKYMPCTNARYRAWFGAS